MTAKPKADPGKQSFMDKLLNTVERVGNKVPHPVLMFFYMMIGVIVLSAILSLLGVSVTEQIAVPVPVEGPRLTSTRTSANTRCQERGPKMSNTKSRNRPYPSRAC